MERKINTAGKEVQRHNISKYINYLTYGQVRTNFMESFGNIG